MSRDRKKRRKRSLHDYNDLCFQRTNQHEQNDYIHLNADSKWQTTNSEESNE